MDEFYQSNKESIIPIIHKIYQNIEELFSKSFYEASIILISKSEKDINKTQKENEKPYDNLNRCIKRICKNPNTIYNKNRVNLE